MTVRYFVEYQMADRRERPEDPGPIRFEVGEQVHLLPNVGNYVQISGVRAPILRVVARLSVNCPYRESQRSQQPR
jgi:hypothetical protein